MFEDHMMSYLGRVLNRDTWGAHINMTKYTESAPKFLDWLNSLQKQEWLHRGLVVWNANTRVVTHLYVNYALNILETIRETDTWKINGLVIGSPAYRMSILDTKDEQSKNGSIETYQDGWVLINQIALSYKQGDEFLEFLVAEEHTLILIAADEDRDVREAYAMVVELLLESRKKKRELKENVMREKPAQKKIIPISFPKGEYLNIPQMAEICDVPVKQIKTWIRSGDIEAIDLSGAGQIVEMGKFTQFLRKRKPSGS
jgi:hypothetical protein